MQPTTVQPQPATTQRRRTTTITGAWPVRKS